MELIVTCELQEVVQILRNIANDLEDCGIDEWESLKDCVTATKANIKHDFKDIGTGI